MLAIDLEFRKGILFVRLSGALTRESLYTLKKEIVKLIDDNGFYQIVINTKALIEIDSYGMDSLYKIYLFARERGGTTLFCSTDEDAFYKERQKYGFMRATHVIGSEIDAFLVMVL